MLIYNQLLCTSFFGYTLASNSADITLWQDFQAGDEEAYTAIYRTHVRAMYRYGMSLVPVSEAFVFDCIHDVFTEIWAKRERLSIPENVRYYLLKALKVRILHLIQRQEKPHQSLSDVDFEELWGESAVDEAYLLQEENTNRQELIAKLISQLPPRQQEALRLRFVEELEYTEIANLMTINAQSAQNLVFRATEKLRKWLLPSLIIFFQYFL